MRRPRPRTWLVGILAGLLGCLIGVPPSQAAKRKFVPVSHNETLRVLEGKKTKTYYRASKEKPVELSVTGPVSFRVLGRRLEPASSIAHLRVEVDGAVMNNLTLKSGAAKSATPMQGVSGASGAGAAPGIAPAATVGVLGKVVARIGAGAHKIRIYPAEDAAVALVRFLPGAGVRLAGRWVAFAPEIFEKPVRLHDRDNETTWYRFSLTKPAGMTIHGPVHLKITTRLDFGVTNGVTQAYVVKTLLDGKPYKGFSLKSRASHTVTYPDLPEITPGKAQSFLLEIPAGTHQFALVLDGTTAGGAAAQIQMLRQELKIKTTKKGVGSAHVGL